MIQHVVLIRFKKDAPVRAQEDLVTALRELPPMIEEIREYRVGLDVVHGPNSAEVGLVSSFDDLDALQRYRVHPAHQKVLKEKILPFMESITASDFEL